MPMVPSSPSPMRHRRRNASAPCPGACSSVGLAILALIALAVFWFLFTARSVSFELRPEPGAVQVDALLHLELQGVHLLRAGRYTRPRPGARLRALRGHGHGRPRGKPADSAGAHAPARDRRPRLRPSGATVFRDGDALGTTRWEGLELPAGTVTLGLQKRATSQHSSPSRCMAKRSVSANPSSCCPTGRR